MIPMTHLGTYLFFGWYENVCIAVPSSLIFVRGRSTSNASEEHEAPKSRKHGANEFTFPRAVPDSDM